MLHAVEKKKSTRAKQYAEKFRKWRAEDPEENQDVSDRGPKPQNTWKLQAEDEITSTIIGPLEFLDASAVYRFLRQLTGDPTDPLDPCCNLEAFSLWPRKDRIEPDGHIVIANGDKQRIFLLEIKWDADLSGDDQLAKQWNEYLVERERSCAVHIFIGKHIGEALRQDQTAWNGRLKAVTWLQFRKTLGALCRDDSYPKTMRRWAALSDQFLDKAGIHAFLGFESIPGPAAASVPLSIFWRPFSGWNGLRLPEKLTWPLSNVFFDGKE